MAVKKEKYKASTRDFRRCITDVLNTKQVQILCKCMHTYARCRAASQEAIIKYRKQLKYSGLIFFWVKVLKKMGKSLKLLKVKNILVDTTN